MRHPLIKTWIQNEYYGEGLANQLMYMLVYGVFLAFLTAFAVLLPRPNQTGCCCGWFIKHIMHRYNDICPKSS